MATAWTKVLALPPRLAAITPCRITTNRSTVTAASRASTTMVTHQLTSPSTDSPISAAPMRALSAIGAPLSPRPGTCAQRRAPPAAARVPRRPEQACPDEGRGGDRVGDLAEVGHLPPATGDLTVDPVGDRGEREDRKGRDPPLRALTPLGHGHQPEHRYEQQPQAGQRVREVPGAGLHRRHV